MLLGLSGYAGSGKDTVAKMIQESDNSWQIKKYAGKLKQIASILTGHLEFCFENQVFKNQYSFEWEMTIREFLQKLGTDAIRDHLHKDAWVKALFSDYDSRNSKWIITDVRFPNEAEAIKQRGGIVVKIIRQALPDSNHPSEISLDEWKFDYLLDNTGSLQDLEKNVKIFLNEFKF